MKKRIDRLLVEKGLADSRQKAQALIMAGLVLIDDKPVTKAGTDVEETAFIRVKAGGSPYVGRGGQKLEGAAKSFSMEIQGKTCLDIGCSTGGFTHFLLLSGAARVYAMDVDITQLDYRVRQDPRVITVERNGRLLEPTDIPEIVDLVTIDVSFISLAMILPRVPAVLRPQGYCLGLVKPQFEVGRERVGKGGIVTNPEDQKASIDKITLAGEAAGLKAMASAESVIRGREGNQEFFVLFQRP